MAGIDQYTKLMLHMDGDDDGTVFSDDSNNDYTITRNLAVTKTSTKKFGTASCYFSGAPAYLSAPDSADWYFGDVFTVDFWINFSDLSEQFIGFFQQHSDSDNLQKFMYRQDNDELYYSVRTGGTAYAFNSGNSTFTPTTSTWYHIALVMVSGTANFYVDGNFIGSETISEVSIGNYSGPFVIGNATSNDGVTTDYPFTGYMDEFRVSKDVARWTETFTPPSTAYSYFKISGSLAEAAKIIIIEESDNSLVSAIDFSAGNYEIEVDDENTKTVIARKSDGEVVGFGNVTPV